MGGGGEGEGVKIRKKFRNRLDPVTFYEYIVEPAYGGRDIVDTSLVRCMCVHPSVRPSGFVRALTSTFMHEFHNSLAQLFSLSSRSAI